MLVLFLKLLLAHIIGDFVLQPNGWVRKRQESVWYLLLHVFVHLVVLIALFISDLSTYWVLISVVTISHLAIDSLKIWLEKRGVYMPALLFVIDQSLHLMVLVAVVFYQFNFSFDILHLIWQPKSLMCLIAVLLVAVVSPIFLRVFFSKWNRGSDFETKKQDSLLDAGMLIGIMERLIIVLFIQVGFLSGIGFLLAAKSIFRFGDLRNAKDTKFTEYILLGTFASFFIAIVVGYLLRLGLRIS